MSDLTSNFLSFGAGWLLGASALWVYFLKANLIRSKDEHERHEALQEALSPKPDAQIGTRAFFLRKRMVEAVKKNLGIDATVEDLGEGDGSQSSSR